MALIMIAMAAAPGFSPLLGGALDHYLAGVPNSYSSQPLPRSAPSPGAVLGSYHARGPARSLAIAKNYFGLIGDRRFVVPAATVSLIMGGLFSIFSAAPLW
jgi:DHA1 family bicyclomycin/chloramphenicol resistance-like MFS transporter